MVNPVRSSQSDPLSRSANGVEPFPNAVRHPTRAEVARHVAALYGLAARQFADRAGEVERILATTLRRQVQAVWASEDPRVIKQILSQAERELDDLVPALGRGLPAVPASRPEMHEAAASHAVSRLAIALGRFAASSEPSGADTGSGTLSHLDAVMDAAGIPRFHECIADLMAMPAVAQAATLGAKVNPSGRRDAAPARARS